MYKLRLFVVGVILASMLAACAGTPTPSPTTMPTSAPSASETPASAATETPAATAAPEASATPAGPPDFAMYGFPTVIASEMVTASTAITLSAGLFTIKIPDNAFTNDVQFDVLTGDPASFTAPSGETPIIAFAFRVTDQSTMELLGAFGAPLDFVAQSPNIVAASKYYNVATDGTLTENATGMTVSDGMLEHPIGGAGAGWLITSPAGQTGGLRTPEEAALAAAGGQKIGGTVNVLGVWGGSELASFMAMLAPFEAATGIDVQYTGTRDVNAVLTTRLQGGNPPDVAGLPGPAQMAQYAQQGYLVDLGNVLDMNTYNSQYASTWSDLGTVNGQLVGLFMRVSVKGLIWYDPKVWDANGYTAPATWDDMMTLSQQIMSTGATPWCVALESGAATGWPGTDWLEDIVLRQAGVQTYNDWWAGKVKWTSPEIKQAWETWGQIVATDGMVYGGANSMLTTNFGNVGDGLFTSPPNCYMVHQASFIADFFQTNTPGVKPVTDFNYFGFPPFQSGAPVNTEMAGDLFGMFNDTPQAEALVKYLITPEAQAIWVQRGSAISPNKEVPTSLYPDELSKRAAEILTSAEVAVFDASDQMPTAMQNAFLQGIVNYVQSPSDLDSILANLDSVQSSAYTTP